MGSKLRYIRFKLRYPGKFGAPCDEAEAAHPRWQKRREVPSCRDSGREPPREPPDRARPAGRQDRVGCRVHTDQTVLPPYTVDHARM